MLSLDVFGYAHRSFLSAWLLWDITLMRMGNKWPLTVLDTKFVPNLKKFPSHIPDISVLKDWTKGRPLEPWPLTFLAYKNLSVHHQSPNWQFEGTPPQLSFRYLIPKNWVEVWTDRQRENVMPQSLPIAIREALKGTQCKNVLYVGYSFIFKQSFHKIPVKCCICK